MEPTLIKLPPFEHKLEFRMLASRRFDFGDEVMICHLAIADGKPYMGRVIDWEPLQNQGNHLEDMRKLVFRDTGK